MKQKLLFILLSLIASYLCAPVVQYQNSNQLTAASQSTNAYESDRHLGPFTGTSTAVKINSVVGSAVNVIQTQFAFGIFNGGLNRYQLIINNVIPTYLDGFLVNIYTDDPVNNKPATSFYAAASTEIKPGASGFPTATITAAGFTTSYNTILGKPLGSVFNVVIKNVVTKFGVLKSPFWLEIRAVFKNSSPQKYGFWSGLSSGDSSSIIQETTNAVTVPTYTGPATTQPDPFISLEYDNSEANNDPHVTGFMGQKFDFCGIPEKVFNYYSDPRIQVNTLLQQVKLPPVPKKARDDNSVNIPPPPVDKNSCLYRFNHTVGTYITSIGIRFSDIPDIFVITVDNGTFTVIYNGKEVTPNVFGSKTISLSCGSLTYINREKWAKILLYNDGYEFTIDTSRKYLNVQFEVPLFSYGLLPTQYTGYVGQTLNGNKVPSDIPEDFLLSTTDVLSMDYPNSSFVAYNGENIICNNDA